VLRIGLLKVGQGESKSNIAKTVYNFAVGLAMGSVGVAHAKVSNVYQSHEVVFLLLFPALGIRRRLHDTHAHL